MRKTPFISQVYDQIRLSIVRGELRAGEQLPSTRQLARDLGVSRIIIVEVYDQLLAEGYLAHELRNEVKESREMRNSFQSRRGPQARANRSERFTCR
jgi:DNA-binding transcriptional regulator YhcF (GntR family)